MQLTSGVNAHRVAASTTLPCLLLHRSLGAKGEDRHHVEAAFEVRPGNPDLQAVEAIGEPGRPVLVEDLSGIDLGQWFEAQNVRPALIGEFEDLALLRVFGQAGVGIFPIPSMVEKQFHKQYGLELIGRTQNVRSRFYAISVERKLKHPAVIAICEAARTTLSRLPS